MRIFSNFLFFEDETKTKKSNTLHLGQESQLILQVDGTASFTLKLYGKVNTESEDFYELGAVSLSTYTIDTEISESGIYSVPTDGISHLYAELTSVSGKVTVLAKAGV